MIWAAKTLYESTGLAFSSNDEQNNSFDKEMSMTSNPYDRLLTDLRLVYEQVTGLPSPKIDVKNPRFPLPEDCNPADLVQSESHWLNLFLMRSGYSNWMSNAPTWMPPAEIYQNAKECVITIDASGIEEDHISVQHMDNVLVVRGTRRFKRGSKDAQYTCMERPYGMFERVFVLSPDVVMDRPKVHSSNGVITITLPRIDLDREKGAKKSKQSESGSQKQPQDKERKK